MKRKTVFPTPSGKECVIQTTLDDDCCICVELSVGKNTIFDYGKDQNSLWKTFSKALKDTLADDYDEEFFQTLFFSETNFKLN